MQKAEMNNKILIVDDERDLREILSFNLSREGYTTLQAASAEEADSILRNALETDNPVELILLDVMMGKKSGFQWATELREDGVQTPIIFLTALDTQDNLLKGFSVGADDYISKPFSVAEVLARVCAVLARSSTSGGGYETAAADRICIGDIAIDLEAKSVEICGEVVKLTKTEFQLLELLAKKPEKTYSREELLDKVWGIDVFVESRTVDVHIARLRKKIEGSGVAISSKSGYGYSLK